jgi:hypothetical protein
MGELSLTNDLSVGVFTCESLCSGRTNRISWELTCGHYPSFNSSGITR